MIAKDQVMEAFRSIKPHELAKYATELCIGVNYTKCSKGHIAEDIADNEYNFLDKANAKYGSFDNWVIYVINSVKENRNLNKKHDQLIKEKHECIRKEFDRAKCLLDELRKHTKLSKDDSEFLFNYLDTAIRYYSYRK